MPAWPGTLPPLTEVQAYTETPGVQALRTEMEEGPAKLRRLPAPMPDQLQFQQLYTLTQTQTMDTFYLTTLAGGTLSFDDTHPRTGSSVTFRLIGRPQYSHLSGSLWTCTFTLEVLP